jgi:hypothetical protein
MPGLPDEDVPAGRLRVPWLKYWHAARACAYAWTHGVDAHDWMPGLSDQDVPAGRLRVPCLKYWHAACAYAYAWTHGVDAHDWMPGLPDEDVPAGRLVAPWHARACFMAMVVCVCLPCVVSGRVHPPLFVVCVRVFVCLCVCVFLCLCVCVSVCSPIERGDMLQLWLSVPEPRTPARV